MKYDVICVGGSFAGLSAAMQLARARRRVLLIDAGKPRNRFAKFSHGFLGQDGKPYQKILQECLAQLQAYPTVDIVHGEVSGVAKNRDSFQVSMGNSNQWESARLLLATGIKDKLPQIKGLQERWGETVLHCPYCHGLEVADQPLGVLATHTFSVHQASILSDWGPVTYFTQGKFHPDKAQSEYLADRKIRIESEPIVELLGTAPKLEGVRLSSNKTIGINALFTIPKTQMASSLAESLGCALSEGPTGPYLSVDESKQTSIEGAYAAGDLVLSKSNATLASAEGVIAGVAIHQSLIEPKLT